MRRSVQTVLAGVTVALATAAVAAPAVAAAAEPVTHRTVYASGGGGSDLLRLTLDARGTVRARTPVVSGAAGTATHTAAGLTLFSRYRGTGRAPEIWLREASGASRLLTNGDEAVFTPGRTAVVVSRQVLDDEVPRSYHSELSLYRLSDGRVTPLFSHGAQQVDARLRYAADGRSIWMLVQIWGEPSFELMQYGLAEDRILRTTGTLGGEFGCSDFEPLPSGTRVVLTCGPRQVWTVRLDTGAVTRRTTVVPANAGVDSVRGRLSAGTLLVSGYTRSSSGARTSWLGALDLRTFTMRWLPGSSGSGRGVTEY